MASAKPADARTSVLLLSPVLRGGGSERVVVHLANHLDRRRFDVTLMLGRRRGPMLAGLEPDVVVRELRARQAVKAGVFLARYLAQQRPQVMLSTLSFGFSAALARQLAGVSATTRLIVRESNMPSQAWKNAARRSWGKGLLMRWSKRIGYRGADAILCQSQAMVADISAHVPDVTAKLCWIGNPVDVERVHQLAEAAPPNWPPGEGRQLVAVGRLTWQKGYDLMLPAFREALATHPNLHLTILGKGAERGSLQALTEQLGIAQRVHFLGFVENPYAYLARADALVLTSRYEGLPNVVLEAQALGVPAIATDAPGGTAEVIQPGFNGYLCAPEVESIATALNKTLAALDQFNRVAIRRRLEQTNAMRVIVEQYEQLLLRTLKAVPEVDLLD